MRGVSITTSGNYYALYRPFLKEPILLPPNIKNVDPPISEDTIAILCTDCYNDTAPKITKVPKFSLKAGIDYGLAWLYLPKLSYLEELLISEYHLYSHVFKLGAGHGYYGMSGNMIAMETDALNVVTKIARTYTDINADR